MSVYEKLIKLLNENNADYRVCEHIAEGRSEHIAKIRGNAPKQAMKAIVVMAKRSKKEKFYYIAVVPGDKMLDLDALKAHYDASKVIFAPLDVTREITQCEIGAIPPFSFNDDLSLIVDPQIQDNEEVVFNAGLLTKSIFLRTADYIRIVQPTFASIAK